MEERKQNLLLSEFFILYGNEDTLKKVNNGEYRMFGEFEVVNIISDPSIPLNAVILQIYYTFNKNKETAFILISNSQYRCYLKELRDAFPTSDLVINKKITSEETTQFSAFLKESQFLSLKDHFVVSFLSSLSSSEMDNVLHNIVKKI